MTRLIDADALLELFPDEIGGLQTYNAEVQAIINSQPTIDAVPVKRGKWLWTDGVHCSNCNHKLQTTGLPTYCPNCGAKMEGK